MLKGLHWKGHLLPVKLHQLAVLGRKGGLAGGELS